MNTISKPKPEEYPAYAAMYIDLIPDDGKLLTHFKRNLDRAKALVGTIPPEKLLFRYAPGKWTIKEVLAHIVDDERIYSYRALRFARNDKTELPGFDQDHFALNSGANDRSIKDIMSEYSAVRKSTIALFKGFGEDALTRMGTADNNRATVRALGYHIAGHEAHHIKILSERYLYS